MKYKYSFDGKAITLFVAVWCLASGLLFAGGLLVGLGIHVHAVPNLVENKAATKPMPAGEAALHLHQAPLAPQAQPLAGAASAPAAGAAAGVTAPPAATPAPAAAAGLLLTPPANACGVTTSATPPPAGEEAFALQMGAFLEASNASRLAAQLKDRGCTAAVVTQLTDYSHRAWSVVRIGPFDSLNQAVLAAADFNRAQGMLALVRPANAF